MWTNRAHLVVTIVAVICVGLLLEAVVHSPQQLKYSTNIPLSYQDFKITFDDSNPLVLNDKLVTQAASLGSDIETKYTVILSDTTQIGFVSKEANVSSTVPNQTVPTYTECAFDNEEEGVVQIEATDEYCIAAVLGVNPLDFSATANLYAQKRIKNNDLIEVVVLGGQQRTDTGKTSESILEKFGEEYLENFRALVVSIN